jgi:hypothetical protein
MKTPSMTIRAAVVVAAGALLLTGCGSEQADPAAVNHSGPATPSPAPRAEKPTQARQVAAGAESAPAPTPTPTGEEEVPVEVEPTELPPGDPGLDAPSVPDPGKPEHDREHEEPARTVVPTEALLDTVTVSGVLAGDWRQSEGRPLECASAPGAVAERTFVFSAEGGQVVQTVATHKSLAAADRAVDELAGQLQGCGWTAERDPRLGTASATLSSGEGEQTAVVISAEGVTVTLVGSGDATASRPRWSSLQDIALGSSCAAAPHGCH